MIFDICDLTLNRRQAESGFSLKVESLAISAGEHVAFTGPSGCGKSTALDILGMILRPSSIGRFVFAPDGHVTDIATLWRGNDLDGMSRLRRRWMGYVLQTGELLPYLTVAENVALAAGLNGGLDRNAIRRRVAELLCSLEVDHLAFKLPSEISIGERQRSAIARAMAGCPRVLLADEPTASLDPSRARMVMQLLLEAAAHEGTTLILVSHDLALVREFGFRELVLQVEKSEQGMVESVLREAV